MGDNKRDQGHAHHQREHEQQALRDEPLHSSGGNSRRQDFVRMYGFTRHAEFHT